MLAKADEMLVANDADVAKADFTLKDLNGKKVTLSALQGQDCAGQLLGDVVPAVPQGDDGPRPDLYALSSRRDW